MFDADVAAFIVDQSPDGIIFAGPDGNIRGWNDAAAAMFDLSVEDAIGTNLDVIIPEQFREAHWQGFEAAIAAGETKHHGEALPTRAQKATGEVFYVELSFGVVKDAQGNVLGALAMARDINERFQQDRANRRRMRELEAELKELRGEPAQAN